MANIANAKYERRIADKVARAAAEISKGSEDKSEPTPTAADPAGKASLEGLRQQLDSIAGKIVDCCACMKVKRAGTKCALVSGTATSGDIFAQIVLFVEGLHLMERKYFWVTMAASVAGILEEQLVGTQGVVSVKAGTGVVLLETRAALGTIMLLWVSESDNYSRARQGLARQKAEVSQSSGAAAFAPQKAPLEGLRQQLDSIAGKIVDCCSCMKVKRAVTRGALVSGTATRGDIGAEIILSVEGLHLMERKYWDVTMAASVAGILEEQLVGTQGIVSVKAGTGLVLLETRAALGTITLLWASESANYTRVRQGLARPCPLLLTTVMAIGKQD